MAKYISALLHGTAYALAVWGWDSLFAAHPDDLTGIYILVGMVGAATYVAGHMDSTKGWFR